MAIIRRIRGLSKKLGSSGKDKIERDVALVLYFAAIAGAIVFHNVRISQYSYEKLAQSIEALTQHDWITPEITRVYDEARKHCRKN
ncbi:MAG: hypothetical protein AMJ65_03895 [Phycisphaerae bacterium SG8_4]|nr:MAG: hypothetical protein AMJ65_03895 [Phycisphaerae bacterium SG8_4]